jgi:hypothetical protein
MVKLASPIHDGVAWGNQVINVDEALIEYGPWDIVASDCSMVCWLLGCQDGSSVLYAAM